MQQVEQARIRTSELVKALASLYVSGLLCFPWKRLFDGSPDTRMANLRRHAPVLDTSPRRPHNIRFFSRWPSGRWFLPLRFRGQSCTFVHGRGDYDAMDVIADFFQERRRLEAVRQDQEHPPLAMWRQRDFAQQVVQDALGSLGQITAYALREKVYEHVKECTQFKPSLAVAVLRLFHAERVLDFSAGWGDRLIGAIAAGVRTYHAWDPNTALKVCVCV